MLLGPLATKDPIPITTYSYENFKEFLTFLYLGKCAINIENVMAIVDLAESYNVQLLKDKCDTFLTNIEMTDANLYTVYANLKMYSLKAALENLFDYISFNVETILSSFGFMSAKKEFILDIVKLETLSTTEENLFNSISFKFKHELINNFVFFKY
uniref:BTB domain-containing protein n=1 Tax=Panagrolaimus sp. ES5 TaxID=591445 RepID=A0AC34GDY4_9BILA